MEKSEEKIGHFCNSLGNFFGLNKSGKMSKNKANFEAIDKKESMCYDCLIQCNEQVG